VANPPAPAVLATLFERPMHAYELASTMRECRKPERQAQPRFPVHVVEALEREKLICRRRDRPRGPPAERTTMPVPEHGSDS
jgi:hypothetical protein